jgi:DNA adenine methylase
MAKKSRPVVREKKTAYKVRVDQRSDPKPKSKLARKLAKLPPPAVPRRRGFQPRPGVTGRDPDGALYVYDEQKAMGFADAPDVARIEAQPFLKWAGGKAQLLAQFNKFFPAVIDRYFEPFLGGGAVFFHLKRRFPRLVAHLRDNNAELINTYLAVRDYPTELMRRLDEHLAAFQADREKYYYLVRSRHQLPQAELIERAARMIFLNKTCFNGLYRVNARGEFNVPIGSHKNPALYDRDNLLAANWALRDAHLAVQDFRVTMNETRKGDFIYIDPPYYPLSATASFTSYTKEDFGGPEQEELAALFADAAQRGVRLMLSN